MPAEPKARLSPGRRLMFKITLFVGLAFVVLLAVFAVIGLRVLEGRSVNNMLERATSFSDTVKRATRYSMLKDQREGVHEIIEDVGRQEGVETIRIFNKKGRIMFSTRKPEIGALVDMQAEACYGCHFKDRPIERLSLSQRSRIYRTRGEEAHRVVSVINPIYTEKACYTDPCHAHAPDQNVLGVLDVGFSLGPLDEDLGRLARWTVGLAALTLVVVAAVVWLVSFWFINRPLSSLLEATRRIADGDYNHPIVAATSDEIGALAKSFDQMRQAIKDKTEDLNESRRLYKTLFEQVPCYISVQDKEFKLLNFNKMFERDFGFNLGQPCYAVYKGRDSVCPNCSVEKSFRDGKVHRAEETVIGQDGSIKYILNLAAPIIDKRGRITSVMELSTDVTPLRRLEDELRKSEEKYRLFFNNNPNPIFVFDRATFEILDANDRALADYSYAREDLIGRSFLDLTDAADQARVKEFLSRSGIFLARVHQFRSDGRILMLNLRASYGEHMGRQAVIIAAADMTEQLETEQRLVQAAKMATLGEMSAGVAHELNQPLSIMATGAHFLLKHLDQDQAPALEKIREVALEVTSQVERATRIINHLREFGRKAEVERSRISLNEPIRGVFSLLGQQMRVRGIRVETELEEDLPLIWGDANRLEQVLINLVINARDAIEKRRAEKGEKRGGLIKVRSFVEDDQVVVTVSDDGVGLSVSEKERIFEPFFTTKDVGKGTGLGLSISYGIVSDYGGTIEVDSTPGQGTTFKLVFPPAEEEA